MKAALLGATRGMGRAVVRLLVERGDAVCLLGRNPAELDRSARGELEVTDLNNAYLARGEMTHDLLEGYWADCGESIEHYLQACNLVAEQGANRIDLRPSASGPVPSPSMGEG